LIYTAAVTLKTLAQPLLPYPIYTPTR